MQAAAPDSVSILPYLQDPDLPTRSARPFVYAEKFDPNGFGPFTRNDRALRDDRYKIIWRSGVYSELYDLTLDPWEQSNLLDAPLVGEDAAAYERLVGWMEDLHRWKSAPAVSLWHALALATALAFLGSRRSAHSPQP